MAQKIESDLYLEGDDTRYFEKDMADPGRCDTPEGRGMTHWVRDYGEDFVKPVRVPRNVTPSPR